MWGNWISDRWNKLPRKHWNHDLNQGPLPASSELLSPGHITCSDFLLTSVNPPPDTKEQIKILKITLILCNIPQILTAFLSKEGSLPLCSQTWQPINLRFLQCCVLQSSWLTLQNYWCLGLNMKMAVKVYHLIPHLCQPCWGSLESKRPIRGLMVIVQVLGTNPSYCWLILELQGVIWALKPLVTSHESGDYNTIPSSIVMITWENTPLALGRLYTT